MTWYFWVWGVATTLAVLLWGAAAVIAILMMREKQDKRDSLKCQLEEAKSAERYWRKEYEEVHAKFLKSREQNYKLEKKLHEFGPVSP